MVKCNIDSSKIRYKRVYAEEDANLMKKMHAGEANPSGGREKISRKRTCECIGPRMARCIRQEEEKKEARGRRFRRPAFARALSRGASLCPRMIPSRRVGCRRGRTSGP